MQLYQITLWTGDKYIELPVRVNKGPFNTNLGKAWARFKHKLKCWVGGKINKDIKYIV